MADAYIEIDFNTVEVHIDDLAPSADPFDALGHDVREHVQDEVLDAIARVLRTRLPNHIDFTVRVKTPPLPVVPLVRDMITIPF